MLAPWEVGLGREGERAEWRVISGMAVDDNSIKHQTEPHTYHHTADSTRKAHTSIVHMEVTNLLILSLSPSRSPRDHEIDRTQTNLRQFLLERSISRSCGAGQWSFPMNESTKVCSRCLSGSGHGTPAR